MDGKSYNERVDKRLSYLKELDEFYHDKHIGEDTFIHDTAYQILEYSIQLGWDVFEVLNEIRDDLIQIDYMIDLIENSDSAL